MKVVTIRDVAREAGVSITTVSRVLNEREDVDPTTRARVQAVIKRLRYIRNTNASSLKQRQGQVAAVILRGRRNSFLTDLAEHILEHGRIRGLHFLIEIIDERADEMLAARRLHLERKLSGTIFLGSNLSGRAQDVERLDMPCVFASVDASCIQSPRVASVSVDNYRSGHEAASRLIALGHRRIALLGYFSDRSDSTGLRLYGARAAMEEQGGLYDPALFADSDFTLHTAWKATNALLALGKPFTALIAISDTVAIGAAKAMFDHGIRVPDQVSLVGFDGIEQGRYCTPSLATMRQPSQEMARLAIDLLQEMQQGRPGRYELLDTTWMDGGSVQAVKAP